MPILLPDTPWELTWELNKPIFVGEAVRLTDLPAGSWSGSGHLNRGHEAVDASPHPNGLVKASHFDLDINWDGPALGTNRLVFDPLRRLILAQ